MTGTPPTENWNAYDVPLHPDNDYQGTSIRAVLILSVGNVRETSEGLDAGIISTAVRTGVSRVVLEQS